MRIVTLFTFLSTLLFSVKVAAQVSCTNWLHLPGNPSFVNVGDLDVPGDKITVEAVFYQTGTADFEGDIISKHDSPADVNYLLRANHAYITTSNGFFETPDVCAAELNRRYHVAMVYDGSTLKFYRNGYLMSQVNATGTLFQNNWQTQIGWYAHQFWNSNFIGYVNEVRIWNIVRTQNELRNYMDNPLPNPSSQTGLLAYYTFDNLLNKQGTAAFDGILNGRGTINNNVPSCAFDADSCEADDTIHCDSWLRIPNSQSYATVGEIDIPGTQITIEGLFSRDSAFTPEGYTSLNIVSKHWTSADVNYLLRVDRAQVTTSNGHFMTPEICELKNKKIYHAAMTYDGATLKFYQNGYLMSQVPCTGAMVQNDYLTTIAATANSPTNNTQLIGYLNEIRIWDVVKSQSELLQYINEPLPNPATQTGLLGYYTFDSQVNKQGNSLYDVTLHGNATINATVTDCSFIADSCSRLTNNNAPDTINTYAAALSINICGNSITADDISTFNVGDTVVIMQMKGASIDSSNTNNFGAITNYNNAGKYEFNYIKSITGNTIEFLNSFINNYDAARGRVQLIRVPYFPTLTVTNTLTCPEWDGTKGGVLILNSAAEINLNAPIDVSNKGFLGGAVGAGFSCGNTDLWAVPGPAGGIKGEGIADYIPGFDAGGGRLATGGGGAYAANSGGGGGGNYGAGGLGGSHSNTCASTTQSMQGEAGDYSLGNRVFIGSGGGGGQRDDQQPVEDGGRGGGIVIIKAFTLNGNNQGIFANGESVTGMVSDEGGAGGGAGGSVVLFVNGYAGNLAIEANGGNGSSNNNVIYPSRCHGPGGGGGGGFVGSSLTVLPPFVTTTLNGGIAGRILNPSSACFNTSYNATNGEPGGSLFNLTVPEATIPFVKNIDSVRINDSLTACTSFDFKGIAYINNNPVQNWEWSFGDGATDSTQNSTHTYTTYGSHPVKLLVTDINGCKDSTVKLVTTSGINFDFVFEVDPCNPLSIMLKAVGDATPEIYWSLGDGTVIHNSRNPVHQYADSGFYLVQYSTGNSSTGCIDTVKKFIFIGYRHDNIILTPDTTICLGSTKGIRSHIDTALPFCWSPHLYLQNTGTAYPSTYTAQSITYSLLAGSEQSNLVVNGDFSNGDNGFASGYTAATPPLASASYFVGTSTLNAGTATANCTDNTTGAGNMLIARNHAAADGTVWEQTVAVTPNTTYQFSAYIQSLRLPATVKLEFVINGNAVISNITPTGTCSWQKHAVLWNSGNTASVNLAIQTTANNIGADDYFAIDDISFATYSFLKDTVRITVDSPFVDARPDTAVCELSPFVLTTSGAVSYSWSPAAGLSNAAIESPVATPVVTTKYFVTGINAAGCTATDSIVVFVNPRPVVSTTGDTSICTGSAVSLFASGGTSYSWEPSHLLNNPNVATPLASPATNNTKYVVTVTGANNCSTQDSFVVAIKTLHLFTISADQEVCFNSTVQLIASGGNYYEWSPLSSVSNPYINNPTSIPQSTTLYTALIRDTVCNYDTTLSTIVAVLPLPVVAASKSNDVSCANKSSQLEATGGLSFSWAPASSLNNPASPSPVATPFATTTYTVTGTNGEGCSNTDTVTVVADFSDRSLFLMPNAFSPNGDGMNDCFRLKYFGQVTQLQFIIFNRWGQVVFETSNADACWDGTYKGKPCSPGNFVYYIKAITTCGNVEKKGNLLLVR